MTLYHLKLHIPMIISSTLLVYMILTVKGHLAGGCILGTVLILFFFIKLIQENIYIAFVLNVMLLLFTVSM